RISSAISIRLIKTPMTAGIDRWISVGGCLISSMPKPIDIGCAPRFGTNCVGTSQIYLCLGRGGNFEVKIAPKVQAIVIITRIIGPPTVEILEKVGFLLI